MYVKNNPILCAETTKSEFLHEWREYQNSLTEKLNSLTGHAELELLFQNWINTTWWDKNVIQIPDPVVFQREILMRSQGEVYWYARTVIPESCYEVDSNFFDRLQHESIRNLIFNEPRVHCVSRVTYPIDKNNIEFYWVKKHLHTIEPPLYVRLAEYSFQWSHSFYLIEILLPQLESIS